MTSKIDDDWGDEGGVVNKPLVFAGVAFSLFVLCSGYNAVTSKVSPYDARLAFVKQDYSEAMSDIKHIEDSGDSASILVALDVKCKILLSRDSGYYNPREGYMILKRVFMANKNVSDASTLLQLAYQLKKPIDDKEIYLKFLSNSGVGTYTADLVSLYLSSGDINLRDKAYKLLKREPESVDRNVSMADILVNDRGGKSNILRGISLLIEAGSMGSPDAEAKLAMSYIKLRLVHEGKGVTTIDQDFSDAINRAITMGYKGEILDKALVIVQDGKYGIQQDLVLASEIKKIRNGVDNGNA